MSSDDTHHDPERRLQAQPSTEPLWTVNEVARYIRLQPETVRMMARRRKIPGIKVGKVWRFRATDIREMMRLLKDTAT